MKRSTLLAAVVATVLALSGCGLISGGGHGTHSAKPSTAASAKPGDMTGGHHYRAGYFYYGNNHAALDIHRVERYPTYSVMYLDVYAVGKKTDGLYTGFSAEAAENGFEGFGLLDSVGGKYYQPLSAPNGTTFGTHFASPSGEIPDPSPGYRYAAQVYFPPLPADIQRITVITPGTTGEMTGIPVLNGGRSQATVPAATQGTPKKGQPVFWKVDPPRGRIVSTVQDLHGHVEGGVKSETRDGGREKIALRTDVLFAFDKANLSAKATSVLDDAISETRAKADPAKPPITLTGYTDSKGSNAYNQKLSERRAAAVQKYVSARLGNSYRYQAIGKGEADPVAPNTSEGADNPVGRAKNRRVEIGFTIKNQKPDVTTTQSATPAPGGVSPPAAWRTSDGPVVGSKNTSDDSERIDVHPFYRDGAYMVGVFDIHGLNGGENSSPSDLEGVVSEALGGDRGNVLDVIGSAFGAAYAYDPAGKTGYYLVRRGPVVGQSDEPTAYVEEADGITGDTSIPGIAARRIFVYYPAPPTDVTKIDFRLGGFDSLGTVKHVPIQ